MYLRKFTIADIAKQLNVPKRTIYHWADVGAWNDLLSHETVEEAITRRLTLLVEREGKTDIELKEIDRLMSTLERAQRMRRREAASPGDDKPRNQGGRSKGSNSPHGSKKRGAKQTKNDVSHLEEKDFAEKFHKRFYRYQLEMRAQRHQRNRQYLKSRQIGATWYFSQEAFEDAALNGDNQIFLSATRAQAEVFRTYIINLVGEAWDIELKGNPITLNTRRGPATLYFLSNSSRSAQSYHGHVYLDEFFWMQKFRELYKVATGMAAHKNWRRTLFSTPSAVTHEAYPYWTGDVFNQRFKKKRVEFPGFTKLQSGILCPDNTWRQIITLDDAEAGGCDLFDKAELQLEYSGDEFRNLFMCEFVDDTLGVFKLRHLEDCYADPADWDDFDPKAQRPYGNNPVWCGYDPSRTRDDASFVVLAPPLVDGGKFRLLERHKWVGKSFVWQAGRIKEICARYNVQFMGIDTTGPGLGVVGHVKPFFPRVTPLHYSIALKTGLVLKAREVIEGGRLEWDAAQPDIAHAFLTIRQTTTDKGAMTYSASRTSTTGHADAAWSIMHALSHEPLAKQPGGGCVVAIG